MHASIGSELSRERADEIVRRARERHMRPRRRRPTRYPVPRTPNA